MSKSTKTAFVRSVTPAKTQAKKRTNPAVVSPPEDNVKKPEKSSIAPVSVKTTAAKKPPKTIRTRSASRTSKIAPDQRRHYVEVAAYYIAERHGFTPGCEHNDWIAAEAEIDRLLADGLLDGS